MYFLCEVYPLKTTLLRLMGEITFRIGHVWWYIIVNHKMRKFKTHISTGRDSTKSVEWIISYILQFSSFVASHYVHLQTARGKSSIHFRNILFLCTNRNNIFRKMQLFCQYEFHKPAELNVFSGDFLRLTYYCK